MIQAAPLHTTTPAPQSFGNGEPFSNAEERKEYYRERFAGVFVHARQLAEEVNIGVDALFDRAKIRTTEANSDYRAHLLGDDTATAEPLLSYEQQVKFISEFFTLAGKELEIRTSQQHDPFQSKGTKSYRVQELTPASVISLIEFSLLGYFPRRYKHQARPTIKPPGNYSSPLAIPDNRAAFITPEAAPHQVWLVPGLTPNKFAAKARRWAKRDDFSSRQILTFTLDLATDHNALPPHLSRPGSYKADDISDALRTFYRATAAPVLAEIAPDCQILAVSYGMGITVHVRLPAHLETSEADALSHDVRAVLRKESKLNWKSDYATQPHALPLSFNPEFERFNLILDAVKGAIAPS